jgi:Tol biopolymer transport system component
MVMNIDGRHRSILFSDSVKTASAPVFSPKGDKIAFGFGLFFQKRVGPGKADIAMINSDGSHLKILTDGSGNFGFPSWSPDGKKIVYRASGGKTEGLFIVDVETRMIDTLTRDSPDNFPGWSPKGDLIAFTSKRDGDYDIYTIQPDGRGLKRLTNTPGNDAHSAWSPDGEWIAFSSARGGFKDESVLHPLNPQPYGEIHIMKADGTDVRMLTDNQFEEATPCWVPLRK